MLFKSRFPRVIFALIPTIALLIGCGGDDDSAGDAQPEASISTEGDGGGLAEVAAVDSAAATTVEEVEAAASSTASSTASSDDTGATASDDVLALIADNYNIAIVVNPSKILSSDLFNTILETVIPEGEPNPIDALKAQLGFDISSVQRLYGFAKLDAPAGLVPGAGPGPFGSNIRSANNLNVQPVYYQPGFGPPELGDGPAFDPSALIPTDMIIYGVADQDIVALQFITSTLPPEKTIDVNGKKCYLLGDNDEFALHLPSSKSVLAGPVESLKSALAGGGGQSDFAKSFGAIDLNSDIVIRALLPAEPETPPAGGGGLNPFAGMSKVTASTVKVNLDQDEIVQVEMEAADDAALMQVNQSLTGALGLGKAILGGQVAQMASNPNLPAEEVEALKFAQQLLNVIAVTKQETSVTLTLTLSDALREQLMGMIKTGVDSVDSADSADSPDSAAEMP